MSFKKLAVYLELSRPINLLITLTSVSVACWIAGGTAGDSIAIILAALTAVLVMAGANAINDSFDIEIDKVNRPNRPLPRGALTRKDARRMWLVVSIVAIGINLLMNLIALLIVVFAVVLLYYYSAQAKKKVLAGNFIVSLMTGMVFIYGSAVVGHIERAVIPALLAFLVNFARELVKDVEDVKGDVHGHADTLPVKYGIKSALALASVSLLVLIGVTLVVVKFDVYNFMFLYIVLVADLFMMVTIVMMWQNSSPIRMRLVSNILKLCMFIGLLAIVLGSM